MATMKYIIGCVLALAAGALCAFLIAALFLGRNQAELQRVAPMCGALFGLALYLLIARSGVIGSSGGSGKDDAAVGHTPSRALGVLGLIAAAAIGFGKAARHGDGLARIGKVPTDFVARLDSQDLLDGSLAIKADQATDALTRSAADANSTGKPVLEEPASTTGIKVKEVDAQGLLGDAAGVVEQSAEQPKIADEHVRQLFEKDGITLSLVYAKSREVYSGNSGEELDKIENDSVVQTVTSVGPLVMDIKNETGELPDEKLGEFSRVRVRFADGRPILSMNEHIVHSDEEAGVDFQHHYELELINGTEEDFRKGKSVVCRYTDKSLRQLDQDIVGELKSAFGPQLQKWLADDPITTHLADRLHFDVTCDETPNARITASPSTVTIEDEGRSVMTARITFPRR
jgi:hypothetical protein